MDLPVVHRVKIQHAILEVRGCRDLGGAGDVLSDLVARRRRPDRDVEVVENAESLEEASSALASGRAEAVRAMARTKREGGVKSPGKPIKPEPPPSGAKERPSSVTACLGAPESPR